MSEERENITRGEVLTKDEVRTKEPPLYRVVLLNDDYTTMDFVVHILITIFNKSQEAAEQIMLSVHNNGSGVAGVYPREVAETKLAIAHAFARQHEFPLKCVMEPE